MEAAAFPPPLPVELMAEGRPQLGSLLLRDGMLSVEQLEWALLEKETSGKRLGEIVVEHGLVSGSALAQALAEQHALGYLDLGRAEIDPIAVGLLPEKIARRLGALPVRFVGDEVVQIAVADPTNVLASDDLRAYRTSILVDVDELADEAAEQSYVEDVRDGSTTSAPAIKLANQLISQAIEEGASDIHFEPRLDGMAVRARIDGVMRHVAHVPKHLVPAVTSRLKIMGELDIADRRSPQDGRISIRPARSSNRTVPCSSSARPGAARRRLSTRRSSS